MVPFCQFGNAPAQQSVDFPYMGINNLIQMLLHHLFVTTQCGTGLCGYWCYLSHLGRGLGDQWQQHIER